MPISLNDFWRLAVESRLLSHAQSQHFANQFAQLRGAAQQSNAATLAEWLVAQHALSRYQTRMLLAGQAGPFWFGGYQIVDRLESGRFTGLFKAVHAESNHPVLLYFFPAADPQQTSPLVHHARAAIAAADPHLVRVFELGEDGPYRFLVLEDVQGQSLAEWVGRPSRPALEVCRLTRQIALGLARLHGLGQVHGDVRPANVWLDAAGNAKLLHFPVVPSAARPDPDYLAPELASGRAANPLSDVYGLGCTMYEMLSGRVPFPGGDAAQKIRCHATLPIEALDRASSVPQTVSQVVMYLMAKNPAVRYQSAAQVAETLAAMLTPAALAVREAASPTLAAYERGLGHGRAAAVGLRGLDPPYGVTAAPVRQESPINSAMPPNWAMPPAPAQQPGQRQPAPSASPQPLPTGPPARQVAFPYMPPSHAMPPSSSIPPSAPVQGIPRAMPVAPMAVPVAPVAVPYATAVSPMMATGAAMGIPGVPTAMTVMPGARPMMPTAMPVMPAAAPIMPFGASAGNGALAPPVDAAAPAGDEIAGFDPLAEDSTPAVSSRRRRAKAQQTGNKKMLAMMAAIPAVGVVVLLVLYAAFGTGTPTKVAENNPAKNSAVKPVKTARPNSTPRQPVDPNSHPTQLPQMPDEPASVGPAVKPPIKIVAPADATFVEVDDDGQSLWTSPTSGTAVDLANIPSRVQFLLLVRPAEILETPEGSKAFEALGPAGAAARSQVESITGFGLANIEQLMLGFIPQDSGPPLPALVVTLKSSPTAEDLLKTWHDPQAADVDGKKYFQGSDWAYYLPVDGGGKVFVMAPTAVIKDMIQQDGPPQLRKGFEKLLRNVDASRHFTLLVSPDSLFGNEQSMFVGSLARLKDPLAQFLGEGVQAAMFSAHLGDSFFVELRVAGTAGTRPDELAKMYQERLGALSEQVEAYLAALNPHPYGRMVLGRFPQMLKMLGNYTRAGAEGNQAVLRCFLPGQAGHNLVMATELALFERGGGAASVATTTDNSGAKQPEGPAEALKKKVSLSFTRDTLEKSMDLLSKEIDTEIVIMGSDLQLDGITKNQSFGLDERDQPAGEILQTVMKKANPDGKLVYIFKAKNAGEKEIIFITTRAAAQKRGDKLPPELAAADAPKKKK